MDEGYNSKEDIWASGFRVPRNAELNVPLENSASLIVTSKISIICNNTRTV